MVKMIQPLNLIGLEIFSAKCKGHGHYACECINKRTMIVRGDEIVSETDSDNEMPPLEDYSDVEDENVNYPV